MRNLLLAGAVLALVPVASFAQITTPDLSFLQSAAHIDLTVMQEAQAAQTSASSPAVKEIAQRLMQDHKFHYDALGVMLKQAAIPLLPDSQAPAQVQQVAVLRPQTGPDFDRTYVQNQIANQRRMQDVLQGEIQNGTDVNLKDFAQRTLPTVQGHLQALQRLQGGA